MLNELNVKCVIFDLDGTLLDSMKIWDKVDVDFLREYGFEINDEFRENIKSSSLKDAPKLFKKMYDIPLTQEQIYTQITEMGKSLYQNEVCMKPYVLEFLQYLCDKNIKMCIATASLRENVEQVLKRLGIEHYFEFLICADDLTTGKDNPEIFNKCLEKFGVSKNQVIVFEDAYHAIKTAVENGFFVCAVYDETSKDDKQKIEKLGCYYIYEFNELID